MSNHRHRHTGHVSLPSSRVNAAIMSSLLICLQSRILQGGMGTCEHTEHRGRGAHRLLVTRHTAHSMPHRKVLLNVYIASASIFCIASSGVASICLCLWLLLQLLERGALWQPKQKQQSRAEERNEWVYVSRLASETPQLLYRGRHFCITRPSSRHHPRTSIACHRNAWDSPHAGGGWAGGEILPALCRAR